MQGGGADIAHVDKRSMELTNGVMCYLDYELQMKHRPRRAALWPALALSGRQR